MEVKNIDGFVVDVGELGIQADVGRPRQACSDSAKRARVRVPYQSRAANPKATQKTRQRVFYEMYLYDELIIDSASRRLNLLMVVFTHLFNVVFEAGGCRLRKGQPEEGP